MTRRASTPTAPPGETAWYGKVPARGDFVSHGLSPGQVRAWDRWLLRGIKQASQRWAGAEFDRRLQTFPAWRFMAWPEGQAHLPWAGVLVPSHDRVGRAFPLTVAQRLDAHSLPLLGWLDIEAALARMADAAFDATDVNDPRAVENFESVLRDLGPVFAPERVAARVDMRVEAPPGGAPARPQQSPLDLLRNSPGTHSLWWSEPAPGATPLPLGDSWPPHVELLLDILALPGDPA